MLLIVASTLPSCSYQTNNWMSTSQANLSQDEDIINLRCQMFSVVTSVYVYKMANFFVTESILGKSLC